MKLNKIKYRRFLCNVVRISDQHWYIKLDLLRLVDKGRYALRHNNTFEMESVVIQIHRLVPGTGLFVDLFS